MLTQTAIKELSNESRQLLYALNKGKINLPLLKGFLARVETLDTTGVKPSKKAERDAKYANLR